MDTVTAAAASSVVASTATTTTSSVFTVISAAIFVVCALLTFLMVIVDRRSKKFILDEEGAVIGRRAPSPMSLPILGNLYSMAGYELPYQSFGVLEKRFGPIISLQLGQQPAVVVNGIDNIKEVLMGKSSHFDSRPNFKRYHDLFSGNKENSLAFCDWSDMHKMRRDMLVQHSLPRNFSLRFNQLNEMIVQQMDVMIGSIKSNLQQGQNVVEIKPIVLQTCANVFTQYFCSRSFSTDDTGFAKMISNFDKIFYEVNQGYLADFLPFLLPIFHSRNLRQMEKWSHEIRNFILTNIIADRKENWTKDSKQCDYVDSLVAHVEENAEPRMEWDTALFALEDIIGGHSAVGNFLVKVFGYVVQDDIVQDRIFAEVQEVLTTEGRTSIELGDRNRMPYTDAVIMEALRLIASPIVPHVANRNSTIGGYYVEKNTLIFLNNYELSVSEALWQNPKAFQPERFLRNGRLVKPDFFLPFGGGRRSCMGYKMVQFLSFSILTNIVQHFRFTPKANTKIVVEAGSLAVSEKSYEFEFTLRN